MGGTQRTGVYEAEDVERKSRKGMKRVGGACFGREGLFIMGRPLLVVLFSSRVAVLDRVLTQFVSDGAILKKAATREHAEGWINMIGWTNKENFCVCAKLAAFTGDDCPPLP